MNTSAMQSMKFIRFHGRFNEHYLEKLNKLPNIERLESFAGGFGELLNNPNLDCPPNRTIKHLVLWLGCHLDKDTNVIADYRTIFPALETLQYIQTPELITKNLSIKLKQSFLYLFLSIFLIGVFSFILSNYSCFIHSQISTKNPI